LLLKIKANCENLKGGKYINLSWLTLKNTANSSPFERSLCRWVLDLAVENYLIHSQIVEKVPIFAQSDGTRPRGQEV
jgi:hypothetical protein